MAKEKTLAILKPDALEKGVIGEICLRIENAGLMIVAMKMLHLDKKRAQGFYAVHKDKSFFAGLTDYMSSGPCVVLVLEGNNAIKTWRNVMGATDPAKAAEGTIRQDFGTDVERNATHGSDAPETAKFEISYFFEPNEVVTYEWI